MLFSAKPKGYVCDRGEQSTLIARLSSLAAPLTIEALVEFPTGDEAAFQEAIASIRPSKAPGFLRTYCGVSPESRFVRRATLDLKKAKETEYLSEVVSSQFRIDASQSVIAVINAFDGVEFDATKPTASKEVVFCGMPSAEAEKIQADLLAQGFYPERLELSSVASLGAVVDYLRFSESTKPTIVLELGAQSTQSFIVSAKGLEATRPIAVGLEAMVPVVQKELGLKDEESARKLFFSNTFDFTGMGASLCKRLLKELQSSMGFYEVQTGQSIGQLVCTVLPAKLAWLEAVIANQIGVGVLVPEFPRWLAARNIKLADDVQASAWDARRMALLGLVTQFPLQPSSDAVAA